MMLWKPCTRFSSVGEVDVELVHPLQVERDGSLAAVDLEAVVVLAARREAARLDGAERAVLEADERRRRVVHRDRALLLRIVGQRPLLDERLERRR